MKTKSRYLKFAVLCSLASFLVFFPRNASVEKKLVPAIPLLLLEDSPRSYDIDEVVETALNSLGEDDSIEAVFLAMDKGYSLRQIVEGIMSKSLAVTGVINGPAGSIVTPEYPPFGIIKTNSSESVSQVIFARSATSEAEGIITLSELVAEGKKVAGNLGHLVMKIVLRLYHDGYSARQIFEGIMLHTIKLTYKETRGTKYIKEVYGIFDQNDYAIIPELVAIHRVFDYPEAFRTHMKKTVYEGHDQGKSCEGADLYIGTRGDQLTYCYKIITAGSIDEYEYLNRDPKIVDNSLIVDNSDRENRIRKIYAHLWYYETTLDENLTNCAYMKGEVTVSRADEPEYTAGMSDRDCAQVTIGENSEFPYLNVAVNIRWNKTFADLGVAACLDKCSYPLDETKDFYVSSGLGHATTGIHKAGTYELAVWIYALKSVVINNPNPDPIRVELWVTSMPYKIVDADPVDRTVYDEESKSISITPVYVAVNKKGSDWPIRNNGYKGGLGKITVRKKED